jgi:peptidyl-dipeptidase A
MTNDSYKKLKAEIDSLLAKRYKIAEKDLGPWNYGDPFFQEGPSIYELDLDNYYREDIVEKSRKYYESIGIDVSGLIKRSDLYEKPGKNQHAYCMDIDHKGDVRTLQNIKNSEIWMQTILHEFGHGIYCEYYDKTNLPFILKDSAHTFTTEAIAMMFGRKADNAQFLENYCHVTKKEAEKIKTTVKKFLRLRQLVCARWIQVMVRFEQQLYSNPKQDLNRLWWDLVKKYQLVNFTRDEPDWAAKYHILAAPIYYHNYMLGEMLASQIHAYLTEHFTHDADSDYSNNKDVGKFLIKNIFEPGAVYRWDEFIKRALGNPLSAKYFVEEFAKDN